MKPIIDDFNSRATSMGLTERVIPEGATTFEILGRRVERVEGHSRCARGLRLRRTLRHGPTST
jgi:hypothetical protein